jgi:hypothetical protein
LSARDGLQCDSCTMIKMIAIKGIMSKGDCTEREGGAHVCQEAAI